MIYTGGKGSEYGLHGFTLVAGVTSPPETVFWNASP